MADDVFGASARGRSLARVALAARERLDAWALRVGGTWEMYDALPEERAPGVTHAIVLRVDRPRADGYTEVTTRRVVGSLDTVFPTAAEVVRRSPTLEALP